MNKIINEITVKLEWKQKLCYHHMHCHNELYNTFFISCLLFNVCMLTCIVQFNNSEFTDVPKMSDNAKVLTC